MAYESDNPIKQSNSKHVRFYSTLDQHVARILFLANDYQSFTTVKRKTLKQCQFYWKIPSSNLLSLPVPCESFGYLEISFSFLLLTFADWAIWMRRFIRDCTEHLLAVYNQSPLTFSSAIYTWKVLVRLIRYCYPVIGDPLVSSSDVTPSMQSVWVSLPKPLAVGVKKVIIPHNRCASFWCNNQIGFLAVVT